MYWMSLHINKRKLHSSAPGLIMTSGTRKKFIAPVLCISHTKLRGVFFCLT